MENLDIIFIDKNSTRRYAMIEAFRSLAVSLFYFDFDENCIKKEEGQAGNYIDSPKRSFDLMLIHPRDQHRAKGINSRHRIWYGGNGYDDNDIPKNGHAVIRPIANGENTLNTTEAKEVVNFFSGCTSKKPSVLLNSKYNESLVLITDFLEGLKDPEMVDWKNIVLPNVLNDVSQEWEEFKISVLPLQQAAHQDKKTLSSFNPKYLQLLDEFINIAT